MRTDSIKPSGDVAIVERFLDVVALGDDPVDELPVSFRSRSGRPANWRCESLTPAQEVNWEWRKKEETEAEGAFVFHPSLGRSVPVSYKTERHVFNGFAFSRSERLETTKGTDPDEHARVFLRHIYDSC